LFNGVLVTNNTEYICYIQIIDEQEDTKRKIHQKKKMR